jgi:predicted nuclease with TOPRIM domain
MSLECNIACMTTLNQALRQTAALKGKIKETETRMERSVVYREEKPPAWQFAILMEQRTKLVDELVKLKTATAVAESRVQLKDGRFLCAAVRELAELRASMSFYDNLCVLDQEKVVEEMTENAYVKGELTTIPKTITSLCLFPEMKKAEHVESLRERFATLNAEVEALNHTTVID